ncbi:MAG: ribonuclease Z [Solobacterium sp.]|nr:ribonuclease Z [Solobacterium sp.]
MLDVTLLGCGGTMPLPNRWLTSLYIRYNGRGILIDCGEGTQIAMKEAGVSAHDIDLILLTHFHGDHVMGLPGILMSMGMSGRTEPVTIAGPKNLSAVVSGLCIAAGIPFPLQGMELTDEECELSHTFGDLLHIRAYAVKHSVPTYGYTIELERLRRFDPDRAKNQQIPVKYWGRLQKGETIHEPGLVYTPDMVLMEARKGLKVTYCTDTRPTNRISEAGRNSDLMVLEGMYGDNERMEAAKIKKHMIFREAALLAAAAEAKELWLTHFSPSEIHPEHYLNNAREIFPNSFCGESGMHKELSFTDDAVKANVSGAVSDASANE